MESQFSSTGSQLKDKPKSHQLEPTFPFLLFLFFHFPDTNSAEQHVTGKPKTKIEQMLKQLQQLRTW